MRRNSPLPIVAAATLAALTWLFLSGKALYAVYLASGAPDTPTPFLWFVLYATPFLFAAVPAALVAAWSEIRQTRQLLLFLSVAAIAITSINITLGGVSAIENLFSAYSTWAFFLGAAFGILGGNYVSLAT